MYVDNPYVYFNNRKLKLMKSEILSCYPYHRHRISNFCEQLPALVSTISRLAAL